MNLAQTIRRLSHGATYSVTRSRPMLYVGGRAQPIDPITFTIEALIEPVDVNELQRLPEGERNIAVIRVYALEELRLADAATGTIADRVTYRGIPYEVECVEPWDQIAGFWRATARKVPL